MHHLPPDSMFVVMYIASKSPRFSEKDPSPFEPVFRPGDHSVVGVCFYEGKSGAVQLSSHKGCWSTSS